MSSSRILLAVLLPTPGTILNALTSSAVTAAAKETAVKVERIANASLGPTQLIVISVSNAFLSFSDTNPYKVIESCLILREVNSLI